MLLLALSFFQKQDLHDKHKASIEDVSEKSTENTKQAAEMAAKAAEKATLEAKMRTEQLKRGSEKISTMFGNMREKVEERASEEYEKSDYAQKKMEDIKAAQEGVGTCAGRNYLIDMFNLTSPISWHSLFLFYFFLFVSTTAKTSWFTSIRAAVQETFAEAKEDLLGEASRGSDGRRKVARRRVRPHEAAWRKKVRGEVKRRDVKRRDAKRREEEQRGREEEKRGREERKRREEEKRGREERKRRRGTSF